jgi:hypothetical protein
MCMVLTLVGFLNLNNGSYVVGVTGLLALDSYIGLMLFASDYA